MQRTLYVAWTDPESVEPGWKLRWATEENLKEVEADVVVAEAGAEDATAGGPAPGPGGGHPPTDPRQESADALPRDKGLGPDPDHKEDINESFFSYSQKK